MGADLAAAARRRATSSSPSVGDKAFDNIFEGEFSRERRERVRQDRHRSSPTRLGYAPSGLADVAEEDRRDATPRSRSRNGAVLRRTRRSRIASTTIEKQITAEKLTGKATVEARYKKHITFDAKPITEITTVDAGALAGLASGDKKKDDDKKADGRRRTSGKKKGGFGAGSITGGKQAGAVEPADVVGRRPRRRPGS